MARLREAARMRLSARTHVRDESSIPLLSRACVFGKPYRDLWIEGKLSVKGFRVKCFVLVAAR